MALSFLSGRVFSPIHTYDLVFFQWPCIPPNIFMALSFLGGRVFPQTYLWPCPFWWPCIPPNVLMALSFLSGCVFPQTYLWPSPFSSSTKPQSKSPQKSPSNSYSPSRTEIEKQEQRLENSFFLNLIILSFSRFEMRQCISIQEYVRPSIRLLVRQLVGRYVCWSVRR